jgi:hypothetical protein
MVVGAVLELVNTYAGSALATPALNALAIIVGEMRLPTPTVFESESVTVLEKLDEPS